jgi:hypothetical protein
MIYVIRKWNRPKGVPKTIKFRSFKNFNSAQFLQELKDTDWSNVTECNDLDFAVMLFNEKVLKVANRYAPLKTLRVKGSQASWVTEEMITEISKRDYMKKVAYKSRSIDGRKDLKKQRNKINRLNKILKRNHFMNKLKEEEREPRKLWNILKIFIPDSTSGENINSLKIDGKDVSEGVDMANSFNSFFTNVGANLASKFNSNSTKNINLEVNCN